MLEGKVILVTHVRHFVGPALAPELLEQGARVFCHDPSFADDAARGDFEASHPGAVALAGHEPDALVEAVIAETGRIDVLISGDAFPAIRAPIEEASLEDLRRGLEALVVEPFALAKAAVPHMKRQKAGRILFVTSAAPLRGIPNYAMYAAGRGAANALALSLAQELGRHNIQVNAFAPNYVESPTYFPPALVNDPEALKKMTANIPLRRLGKPEEAAKTLAFLASDAAGFMTGLVLPFAGGWA